MATNAVSYDTRHDEDHADDSGNMRQVLEPRVADVVAGSEVDEYVKDACEHEQQQPESRQSREITQLGGPAPDRFYRQHLLVIHRFSVLVNSIASVVM